MKLADLKNKNLLIGLAVLAILAIFLVVWQPKQKPGALNNQMGAGFPEEITLEAGARVIQNSEQTMPDGRHQAVRAFISKNSVQGNYEFYLDILAKKGWEVTSKTEIENFASIFASKSGTSLDVGISKNTNTGLVEVTIYSIR